MAATPSQTGHCSTPSSTLQRERRGYRSIMAVASAFGFSQHPGMVVVADGTQSSKRRLERVLPSDPGMGILRHADAGYSRAIEFAAAHDIGLPIKPQPRN